MSLFKKDRVVWVGTFVSIGEEIFRKVVVPGHSEVLRFAWNEAQYNLLAIHLLLQAVALAKIKVVDQLLPLSERGRFLIGSLGI